jgi:Spy/CpxP family protein refolding chaperone
MRKSICLLAACLTLATVQIASAEVGVTPPKGRGPEAMNQRSWGADEFAKRLERMTKGLGLTKKQQEQIKPILQDEYDQLEKLRGNDTFNRDERRAKLKALNESTYDKMKPFLTPNQLKQHEAIKKLIKNRRHEQRGSKPGPEQARGRSLMDPERRLNHMTEDLKLTEEQQAKIKPIINSEFAEISKLRGNDTLNQTERRDKLQALNQQTTDQIRPILTQEQLAKFETIKAKIKERRNLKKSTTPEAPK